MPNAPQLLTIGHSNHPVGDFQRLLAEHRVEVLVDVRSWPHSRYVQWADRSQLPQLAGEVDAKYLFLGDVLGGRPDDPSCYDEDGHVLYGMVAIGDEFGAGLARLRTGLEQWRVAIMCSEEDPTHCHRRLLVSKVLIEQGVSVTHIRGDGRTEKEPGPIRFAEGSLLDDEETLWRSSRSVSRKRPQSDSLAA
jgi:uncharacterized protein (DUF488 family)